MTDLATTVGWAEPTGTGSVVRALQDPTRREILLSFYADPEARTVDEVAASAGVHRTVAFGHLELLAGLGYLAVARRRGRLGKPAKLYRLSAPPISFHHPQRRFAELGRVLARALAGLGTGAREAAVASGFEQGRRLSAGASGLADALDRLQVVGADLMLTGDRVTVRNCVFREACPDARTIVCGVQAGIIAGAAAAAGVPVTVVPLGPTADGRGCEYTVQGTAGIPPEP